MYNVIANLILDNNPTVDSISMNRSEREKFPYFPYLFDILFIMNLYYLYSFIKKTYIYKNMFFRYT